jgi:hypothetical protein
VRREWGLSSRHSGEHCASVGSGKLVAWPPQSIEYGVCLHMAAGFLALNSSARCCGPTKLMVVCFLVPSCVAFGPTSVGEQASLSEQSRVAGWIAAGY